MTLKSPFLWRGAWTLGLSLALAGCGGGDTPKLGRVKGTITFDGKPLADATVKFVPTAEGAASSIGKTNDAGAYEMYYASDAKGAVIGKHEVRVSTFGAVGEGCERTVVPEKIPARYNARSELTEDVKAGANNFNFELKSGGDIIQPDAPGSGSAPSRRAGCF